MHVSARLNGGYLVFILPAKTNQSTRPPTSAGALAAALYKFPEYASKNGYKTPNSISDGSMQYAYDTQLNMFEYLQANPPRGVQFNHHMGGYRQGRPAWMDQGFYPVQERLVEGVDTGADAALIVDIGGSLGHDLDEFRRKHPDAPGRLVLQDLPVIIGQIVELDSRIERMPYDFYTEQPVKGAYFFLSSILSHRLDALSRPPSSTIPHVPPTNPPPPPGARAYYMHSVLHDWPDETCATILANVKAAMKPGYSRLLINENVVPPERAQWEATALDIMMLTLLSSRERTEGDWRSLVEGLAGLKITNIYTAANGVESIIECELVE